MFEEIRRVLPKPSIPWVLLALQQDDILRQQLADDVFMHSAVTRCGAQPERWSPAALALAALGVETDVRDVREALSASALPIAEDLLQRAETLLAGSCQAPQALLAPDLTQAALYALALLERFRQTSDWETVIEEVEQRCSSGLPAGFDTALACVYALAPEPLALLRSLINSSSPTDENFEKGCERVVHVLLSQPLPAQEQQRIFETLLIESAAAARLALLRAIHTRRPGMAGELAQNLLQTQPEIVASAIAIAQEPNGINKLDRLHEAIEICRMANQQDTAEELLHKAETLMQTLQANLAGQLANTRARKGDTVAAKAKLEQMEAQTKTHDGRAQAIFSLNLMDGGNFSAAGEIIASFNGAEGAEGYLAQACFALHSQKDEKARQFALQALEAFAAQADAMPALRGEARQQTAVCLRQLAHLLLNLEFPYGACAEEAIQAAQLSLSLQAKHVEGLCILAQAQRLAGKVGEALETAYLAVGLAPENRQVMRSFAQALESAADWQGAFEAWKFVCGIQDEAAVDWHNIDLDDLRCLALCAMQNERAALAVEALQHVLTQRPGDSELHACMGKAYLALAEESACEDTLAQAIEHYQEAARIQPHNRLYFQELSQAYASMRKQEEALEAARQALGLAPADMENLAWFAGQTMRLNRPLEAADVLEWAAKLYPQELGLQIQLARVYTQANQAEEARAILEKLRADPSAGLKDVLETAHGFLQLGEAAVAVQMVERAQSEHLAANEADRYTLQVTLSQAYQKAGNPHAALKALQDVIQLESVQHDPQCLADACRMKADLHLELEQPAEALKALERALTALPQSSALHYKAMDILQQSGNLAGALSHAQALVNCPLAERLEAAEFALQMLDIQLASQLLAGDASRLDLAGRAKYTVLRGEFALELDADAQLENEGAAVQQMLEKSSDRLPALLRARLKALQARMRGNASELESQVAALGASANGWVANGEAYVAGGEFSAGLAHLREAVALSPLEPRAYLALARGLVNAAEVQRMCAAANTVQHTPGAAALAPAAYEECKNALRAAASRVADASALIQRWVRRAQAAFDATVAPDATLLSCCAADVAAYIASLPRGGALPHLAGTPYEDNWRVLAACALALSATQAEDALQNALLAAEHAPTGHYLTPLLDAWVAMLARRTGDLELAGYAIQKAIKARQNEAAWFAQAAEISLENGDAESALTCYDLALALQPQNVAVRLKAAYVLLELAGQPVRAAALLEGITDFSQVPPQMNALLAEALEQAGNPKQALVHYRKAFTSTLLQEAEWRTRLPLGLARAALQSGQKAVAITALQDALKTAAQERSLWQALCEAYLTAGHADEAMEAARQALQLAEDEDDVQTWFAEQALRANQPLEAVTVLSRMIKLHPQEINLYVRLARALMRAGRKDDALATLRYARLAPGTGFQDLMEAAQGLLDVGEADAAVTCLERARSEFPDITDEERFNLLLNLGGAYSRSGNLPAGLESAQSALALKPNALAQVNPLMADLYLQMQDAHSALASLQAVLDVEPQNALLRERMLETLRGMGDTGAALEQAKAFLSHPLAQRLGAADFALQMLELDLAASLLAGDDVYSGVIEQAKYLCLMAETALEVDADAQVSSEISLAGSLLETQTALFPEALKGRVLAHLGRLHGNGETLRSSLPYTATSVPALLVSGEAQLVLGDFSGAQATFQQAVLLAPHEPRAYLALAKAFVLAAEAQHVCQKLGVMRHAPGEEAVSAQAYESCTHALQEAYSRTLSTSTLIQRWSGRAQAAFDRQAAPDSSLLAGDAADVAAYLAALGNVSGIEAFSNMPQQEHWRVLVSAAIGLAETAPAEALQCALLAAGQIPQGHFYATLMDMLTCRLARRTGDGELAAMAAQKAISAWNDEGGWLLEAAQVAAENADTAVAVNRLEMALALEAENVPLRLQAAHILLNYADQPVRAAALLGGLSEDAPVPVEMHALLGEALVQSGSPVEALKHFRKALDSSLVETPQWRSRLAAGFGNAALQSQQPLQAVAVLQDALASDSGNASLWQSLSEAFAGAGLLGEAMDAARHALALHPADVDMLVWFAERALQLNQTQDAVRALTQALKVDERNVSLHLKLAQALLKAEQRPQALTTLERIVHMPDATLDELLNSARALLEFDEPALAIACLERARKEFLTADDQARFNIYQAFARAYHKNGNPLAGLEAAEIALGIKPEALGAINQIKADLYLQMEQPREALVCLQAALEANPQDGATRKRMLEILRSTGDMLGALEQAKAFTALPLAERLDAADFALQMLETSLAEALLDGDASRLNGAERVKWACLKAELALENDPAADVEKEINFAKDLLAKAGQTGEQEYAARMYALEGRIQAAASALQNAEMAGGDDVSAAELIAFGQARISLGQFAAALEDFHKAVTLQPLEARPHLALGRGLVLQAEAKQMCHAAGAIRHAPGEDTLSNAAFEECKDALGSAASRVFSPCALIQRWLWRAEAVFGAAPAQAALLKSSADDAAAYVLSLARQVEPGSALPETPYANTWRVNAAAAFALAETAPQAAMQSAAMAAEEAPAEHFISHLLQAFGASLARRNGDEARAIFAIQKALQGWGDEPNWLIQAADILAAQDAETAADYLSKAVAVQPQDIGLRVQAARILLDKAKQPARAAALLSNLPEPSMVPAEMHVILAEAMAQSGNAVESLAYYRKVFDSALPAQEEWQARIALGFAQAARQNNQPATAIAALQDAIAAAPNDPALWQAISDAFAAANLFAEALDAAHHALAFHPADLETIMWFARQGLALDAPLDAVEALSRAAQLAPRDVQVLVQLAQALRKANQRAEALTTLERIVHLPDASFTDLLSSAEHLLAFDEPGLAIACLERARAEFVDVSEDERFDLLMSLAKSYQRTGNPQAGLEAVEQALTLQPHKIMQVNPLKADLYAQLEKPQAALACLEQVLGIEPNDAEARYQVMNVLRRSNDLAGALEHAKILASSEQPLSVRLGTAQFAYQMLQTELARNCIGETESLGAGELPASEKADYLKLLCLKGETALEIGKVDEATRVVEAIAALFSEPGKRYAPDLRARLAALMARLGGRAQAEEEAFGQLKTALEEIEKQAGETDGLLAVCEAALELGDWNNALRLVEKAVNANPGEPRPYLVLSRTLVKRAEAQRVCRALGVQRHAPGEEALSDTNREKFAGAIRNATQRITAIHSARNGAAAKLELQSIPAVIQRWWVRGRFVFDEIPSQEVLLALSKLPANAEDTAAYIAALGRVRNLTLAAQVGRDYPYHPQVLAELALALMEKQPAEALEAATTAVENLADYPLSGHASMYHALVALTAQKADEKETALQAIEQALEGWEDEAAWHALAANLCSQTGDVEEALVHMEKAAVLHPQQAYFNTQLGQMYMQQKMFAKAGKAFQAVTQLAADDVEAWTALSKAYLAAGDINKAGACVEESIRLKPDGWEAYLLRAEIAVKAGDVKGAYKFAKTAMQMDSRQPQVYRVLAQALAGLEQPEKALRALEKAAQVSSEPMLVHLERIQLIRRMQGDKAALPALQELVEQYPDDAAVLAVTAETLAKVEQYDAALQAAQIALQNAQGVLDDEQQASLHHLAGRMFQHAGQLDQAVHHLSEAVRLHPEEIEACMDLGLTYQERRQHAQALQVYKKAIQLMPNDPRPYYLAGQALKESRDYSGAEKMLQKAAQLAPDDLRIQRLLGSVVAVNLVHGK